MQISCAVTAQLISTFVFATQIVQSLFLKFQASSVTGKPSLCRTGTEQLKTNFLMSRLILLLHFLDVVLTLFTVSVSVRNIAFFALCFYGDVCDEQNDTHWKRQVMVGVVLSVKHVHVMYNPLHPTLIYSKTGVYRMMPIFSHFAPKH